MARADWNKLGEYLKSSNEDTIILSFSDIIDITDSNAYATIYGHPEFFKDKSRKVFDSVFLAGYDFTSDFNKEEVCFTKFKRTHNNELKEIDNTPIKNEHEIYEGSNKNSSQDTISIEENKSELVTNVETSTNESKDSKKPSKENEKFNMILGSLILISLLIYPIYKLIDFYINLFS